MGQLRRASIDLRKLTPLSGGEVTLFDPFQPPVSRRLEPTEVVQIWRIPQPIPQLSRVASFLGLGKNVEDHPSLPDAFWAVKPQDADEHSTVGIQSLHRSIPVDAKTVSVRNQTRVRDSKVGLQTVTSTAHVKQIGVMAFEILAL